MFEENKADNKVVVDELSNAIQEVLNKNKSNLREATIKMVKEELLEKIKYQISDPINVCIADFIRKEIKPEIEKYLIDSKPQILVGLAGIINEIGESVKTTLAKKAAENLASGWKMDKLIEALFK